MVVREQEEDVRWLGLNRSKGETSEAKLKAEKGGHHRKRQTPPIECEPNVKDIDRIIRFAIDDEKPTRMFYPL